MESFETVYDKWNMPLALLYKKEIKAQVNYNKTMFLRNKNTDSQ